jgi:hypothetical protein
MSETGTAKPARAPGFTPSFFVCFCGHLFSVLGCVCVVVVVGFLIFWRGGSSSYVLCAQYLLIDYLFAHVPFIVITIRLFRDISAGL